MTVSIGIPSTIINLIQQGLVERQFHDSLFPNTIYRQEAMKEEWEMHAGETLIMSRPSLLAPAVRPLSPGSDPTPKSVLYEQWAMNLGRYGDTLDTSLLTSAVAVANLFMRNVQSLGLGAARTINMLPRDKLFSSYISGATALSAAAGAGDTTITVASLNGFRTVLRPTVQAAPLTVSSANPLPISIAGVTGSRNVIGYNPADPEDPDGPGVLVLSAAIGGGGAAARAAVIADDRPQVIRVGGGDSVDAIGAGDTILINSFSRAVNTLRANGVMPHEDGWFHAHISPETLSQLQEDPVFQRMHQSLPESDNNVTGFCGYMYGCKFFANMESPNNYNCGATTSTGSGSSLYSTQINGETVNHTGVRIARAIVTGRGGLYERTLDEMKALKSEAGINGKVGEFDIINGGLQISTEDVRLILRAPQNRMQDIVSATWSLSSAWACPTDIGMNTSPSRFKRAVVIEHALV